MDEDVPRRCKGENRWLGLAKRRLPILEWAPRYDRLAAVADLVAGVTLGLTLVPQAMAYASLAGLPVQYGLYSSFMGTILYMFVGTVKEVSIGPTSLMALLTLQATRGLPLAYVPLLAFLSGWVVMLMGILRLGFLVEFISPGVSSGFMSGTAVLIVAAQLKGILGVSFTAETLVENVSLLASHWRDVRLADSLLGVVCCVTLLLLRKLKDVPINSKRPALKKCLWLVSIGRNAIVVCAASVFAYCTHGPAGSAPLLTLSGRVASGVPALALPHFSVEMPAPGGTDEVVVVGFLGMVHQLGSALLVMPVVMVLANIAIASSFASGRPFDATQEMLALGLCNTVGALAGGMPTCGAFTRSAVSHSSGVSSPAAGLYSGIITLIALSFMTKYFYYIPKACLSAVLICAVIFMIDIGIFLRLWRRSKGELCVLCATLATALLLNVELCVPCGVCASALVLLARLARQVFAVTGDQTSPHAYTVIRPPSVLVYFLAPRLARRVAAAAAAGRPVLIDCSGIVMLDYTAVQMLERLVKKRVILYRASAHVLAELQPCPWACPTVLRAQTEAEALSVAESKESKDILETDALLNGKLREEKDKEKNAPINTVVIS